MTKTIRVAGDCNYPPYEYLDSQGIYQGYNVNLMNYIASEHGFKVEFYPMPWEYAKGALQKGEVDMIMGMNYSPDRADQFSFCLPTTVVSHAVFVPAGIKTISSDMVIGVQEGDIGEDFLAGSDTSKARKFSTHAEGVTALVYGDIDAFIGNETTIACILEELGFIDKFRKLFDIKDSRAYCPVVRRNDKKVLKLINQGISKYSRYNNKWIDLSGNGLGVKTESDVDLTGMDGFSIIGQSHIIAAIKRIIDKIKDIDSPVLISGETGTGKELVVREIHFRSWRSSGPLEVVNCAALPLSLLESELFGYEKGAFTGATAKYPGRILMADGGTLFLDEIGELEPAIQAKLLRVLQNKVITPLGSTVSHKVDVRIIAATNRNLYQEVEEGRFREDLFYRLNVIEINTPPLRERREDLPLLFEHLLVKVAQKLRQDKKQLSLPVYLFLQNYDFPGNVRELENILERACALADGNTINMEDLPPYLNAYNNSHITNNLLPGSKGIVIQCGEPLEQVEEKVIKMNLDNLKMTKREIAEKLGISERTLRYKINRYNL